MTPKRVFDVFWASVGLVVLAPLMAGVAVAILLDSGPPVLFRQERIGFRGRPFRILKFRTMRASGGSGALLTVAGDARITRVGRWLRRTKLDELPQLLNVLRGEMTFVGPRPEVARYVAQYTTDERRVLELKPGITDPASNKYRDESALLADAADPERLYVEEIMPDKIRMNLAYAERASVLTDTLEILRTLNPFSGRAVRAAPPPSASNRP